jgi:hypothetical protein
MIVNGCAKKYIKEEKGKNMSWGKNRRKIRRFDQQKTCQSLKPEREGQ